MEAPRVKIEWITLYQKIGGRKYPVASGEKFSGIVDDIHDHRLGDGLGDYDVYQHIYADVKGIDLDEKIFSIMEADEGYDLDDVSAEDIMSVLSQYFDEKIFYFDYEKFDGFGNLVCLFNIDLSTMTGTITV